jgi:archaellum component FlaC
MENQEFQNLIVEQFKKMDEQFKKIDDQLGDIKLKLEEHDKRFDILDGNVDIVARYATKLFETQEEIADIYIKAKQEREAS